MTATSTIFPVYVRAECRQGQAFARFQSEAQRTSTIAKAEFKGVADTIDQALALQRINWQGTARWLFETTNQYRAAFSAILDNGSGSQLSDCEHGLRTEESNFGFYKSSCVEFC